MLRLEMLPAEYGDALWLEYGDRSRPKVIAIDGGPQGEAGSPLLARLRERTASGRKLKLELLIITHVDADHINGALAALQNLPAGVTIGEVWFNGFRHLVPKDQLGPETGEMLSRHLKEKGLPWNQRFAGNAVVVRPGEPLPAFDFEGLRVTLLSPTPDKLKKLHKVWKSVVKGAGVAADTLGEIPADQQETKTGGPGDLLGRSDQWPPDVSKLAQASPQLDAAEANGSSIGVLAEIEEGGKRAAVLLGADCHAPVLEDSIRRLLASRSAEKLRLDAFKLPHHGSRHNLTNGLLEALSCRRYLFSTNGDRFSHPDHEAIARVLVKGGPAAALFFNYRSPFNEKWQHAPSGAPSYSAEYADGHLAVSIP